MPNRPDPYRRFNFLVEWDGGMRAGFSEVTGLEDDVPAIDHRDGGGTGSTGRTMHGLSKFNDVTLKRGMTRDSGFSKWLLAAAGSPPRDLSISLPLAHEGLRLERGDDED